jgi:ribonuclease HI
MSEMINFYWSPIWKRRHDQPSASDVYRYLSPYPTRVPAALNPSTPSLSSDAICEALDYSWQELLSRVVNGSNNSCPGPDGIPFAAYRNLCGISAKFLLEVLILLANGTQPPPGFNVAHLFLIPKDASGKVLSHRPLAVANAENRLVSFAIATVMGPACQAILHPAQKGFIPGRKGQEHVHEFADLFYGALNGQSQAYALFTDNRKAFDSIDHQFIHALLDTMGFSRWIARAIAMLYWCATLSPVLSEHTGVLLRVERGVKQGCPLSPLIFAICYDPLLHYLQPTNVVHPLLSLFAFADDLNIFSFSLAFLIPSIKVIDQFRHFSGLGINIDKCSILSTRTPHLLAYRAVSLSPWPLLRWVTDHTYLGVVFSREPSAEKIYERPLGRLRRKAGLYRSVFRSLPLHLCIVTANVFLVSLFSYIIQFYLPGSVVVEEVYSILRSLIIPFHGSAYSLPHLFLGPQTGFFGLPTPLRDLDGWAITTLANKVDLSPFHGLSSAIIPGFDPLDKTTFSSFRVTDHINYAVLDLTNQWLRSPASEVPPVAPSLVPLASADVLSGVGLGFGVSGDSGSFLGVEGCVVGCVEGIVEGNVVDSVVGSVEGDVEGIVGVGGGVVGGVVGGDGLISSSDLLANSSSVRKVLYRRYIRSYWGRGVGNPVDLLNGATPISLAAKLGRWGLSAGHQACLHKRWAGPKFPKVPHLLAFHFRMLFNALPSDRRLSPIDSFTHTALHCYFCGLTDLTITKSLDSIEHIYSGECPVVRAAHYHFMSLFGPPFPLSLENSLLAYPLEPEPVRHRARLRWVSTLFFNHALFQLRRRLFMSRELAPPAEVASRMLFESLRFDWNSFVSGYLKGKPFRIYRVSPLTNRLVQTLNDKPFPTKKKLTSALVLGEIESIPTGAHSFYTDGSANPNPGPCGAGVVHLLNGSIVHSFSVPLGRGTNNVGELYAAGVALSAMALVLEGSPDSPLTFYLLSDSSFVLDLLLGRSQLRSKHPALVSIYPSVKKLWRSLAARATLRALKVKGHSGLRWNDYADRLADSARRRSVATDGSRIELCAREGVFDLCIV